MKNEIYKEWEKRPAICGFAISCRWQNNRDLGISNHIVYEFIFQWGVWVYECMVYEPISAQQSVQRIGLRRWISAMLGAIANR